jgi:uncharacterized membrane protein
MDSGTLFAGSVRWLHILFGITWIGLLYYFNFVQATAFAQAPQDAKSRQTNFITLVPRALLFFRWAAMLTFLAGLTLLIAYGAGAGGVGTTYFNVGRGHLILIGALAGTLMMINVWGIIWPNQKRMIEGNRVQLEGGAAPADYGKWARRAFLASRTNTLLSIPMVFFMVAAPFMGTLAR